MAQVSDIKLAESTVDLGDVHRAIEADTTNRLKARAGQYDHLAELATAYKHPALARVLAKLKAAYVVAMAEVEMLADTRKNGAN